MPVVGLRGHRWNAESKLLEAVAPTGAVVCVCVLGGARNAGLKPTRAGDDNGAKSTTSTFSPILTISTTCDTLDPIDRGDEE
jgi:hypothetical protein